MAVSFQGEDSSIVAPAALSTGSRSDAGSVCFTGIELEEVDNSLGPIIRRIWAKPIPKRCPEDLIGNSELWAQRRRQGDWYHMHQISHPKLAKLNADSILLLTSVNPEYFQVKENALVINIKADNLEHVAWAVQNGYWINAPSVSRRIGQVWRAAGEESTVYLLFSITGSKQYCALAEMRGEVDKAGTIPNWQRAGDEGAMPISFLYVKNVPFTHFAGIENGHKHAQPVTNMWNGMLLDQQVGYETMKRYIEFPHYRNILVFPVKEGPCPEWSHDHQVSFSYHIGEKTLGRVLHKLTRLANLNESAEVLGTQVDADVLGTRDASTTTGGSVSYPTDTKTMAEEVPSIIVTSGTGDLSAEPYTWHPPPRYSSPTPVVVDHTRRRVVPLFPPGLDPATFNSVANYNAGNINCQAEDRNTTYQEPYPVYHRSNQGLQYAYDAQVCDSLDAQLSSHEHRAMLPMTMDEGFYPGSYYQMRRHSSTQIASSCHNTEPSNTQTGGCQDAEYQNEHYQIPFDFGSQARLQLRSNSDPANDANKLGITSIARQAEARFLAAQAVLPIQSIQHKRELSVDSIDSFGPRHHVNAWRTQEYNPRVEHERRQRGAIAIGEDAYSFESMLRKMLGGG